MPKIKIFIWLLLKEIELRTSKFFYKIACTVGALPYSFRYQKEKEETISEHLLIGTLTTFETRSRNLGRQEIYKATHANASSPVPTRSKWSRC